MKQALVTGGSRGIGRAIALRVSSEGYTVSVQGRDTGALSETCQEIGQRGGGASSLVADLSVESGIQTVIAHCGGAPLDLLVNSAGVAVVKPLEEISLEEWNRTIAVNVTAPFMLVKGLLPAMPGGGAIVNIMSMAAYQGIPGWSSYCMSKFALDGFTRSIREELRDRGIRVINVYPSATNTGMWENVPGEWPREKMLSPEEVAEAVVYAVTRPSSILVEDIRLGNLAGKL